MNLTKETRTFRRKNNSKSRCSRINQQFNYSTTTIHQLDVGSSPFKNVFFCLVAMIVSIKNPTKQTKPPLNCQIKERLSRQGSNTIQFYPILAFLLRCDGGRFQLIFHEGQDGCWLAAIIAIAEKYPKPFPQTIYRRWLTYCTQFLRVKMLQKMFGPLHRKRQRSSSELHWLTSQ